MMHNGLPFVDAHLHVYRLEGFGRIMEIARDSQLDAINFLGLSQYDKQYMAQNAMGMLLKALHPGKVYLFAGLHHHLPGASEADYDLARQAKRLAATGCDGFKILEGKPNCHKRVGKRLDGPEFRPFFEYAQSEGKPVLWHAVDPEICWDAQRCPKWFRDAGYFYDSTFPTEKQIRDEVVSVLRSFPRLKVIFAHFFFLSPDVDAARRFLDDHPSAMLDLTPGDEMYITFSRNVPAWRKFFTAYQDRILFGTDNTDDTSTAQMGELSMGANNVSRILRFLETDDTILSFSGGEAHGLSLEQPVVATIQGANFQRVAGGAPLPLNLEKCMEYCHWLRPFAERSEESGKILPQLDEVTASLNDQ
jgi:hypothetical protein